EGGNILGFVMKLKSCDLKGALAFLEKNPQKGFRPQFFKAANKNQETLDLFKKSKPLLLEVKPIYHFALKEYLKERCIGTSIAYRYLQEIKYQVASKEYFALGFKNRAGGWELRSSVFKGCIGKKDI